MPQPVPIGARGEASEIVEFRHTLTAHHPSLPGVYSTPDMIRLMETAGFRALHPYMDEGEISVGTSINVVHRAPAALGEQVTAEAVLESFDGRFYVLRVTARTEGVELGSGTIGRAIVNLDKFKQKWGRPSGGGGVRF